MRRGCEIRPVLSPGGVALWANPRQSSLTLVGRSEPVIRRERLLRNTRRSQPTTGQARTINGQLLRAVARTRSKPAIAGWVGAIERYLLRTIVRRKPAIVRWIGAIERYLLRAITRRESAIAGWVGAIERHRLSPRN